MLDNIKHSNGKYNEIIQDYNQNNFESVIEKIKILEEDTFENPFILNLLGASYLKLGENQNAQLYFNYALDVDPNYKSSIINLANIEFSNGLYQNAFDYYAKLFNDGAKFEDAEYLGNMGMCLYHLGHKEDGIALLEEAIKVNPECENAYFQLAEIMYHNKDPEAVISYYYKILDQNPNSYKTYFNLGNYFKKLKCFNMSINFYDKCIDINPRFNDALFQKANIFSNIGEPKKAINILKQVIESDNQNSNAFNLIGLELEKLNLKDEAKERYLDAIYLDPNNSDAYYNLGHNLIEDAKLIDALECLQKNQKVMPFSNKKYEGLANIHLLVLDYLKNKNKNYHYPFLPKINNNSLEKITKKLEIDLDKNDEIKIFEKFYSVEKIIDPSKTNKKRLPIILVGYGQSDTQFVQSLLDRYVKIPTIPGNFLQNISKPAIWSMFQPDYTEFDWRENLSEVICNNLVSYFQKNNCEILEVDQDIFKQYLIDSLMEFDEINSKIFCELIVNAYDNISCEGLPKDSDCKKILFNQQDPTNFDRLIFNYYYPNSKNLFIIRNPIQMLESQILEDLKKLSIATEGKNSYSDDDSFYKMLTATNKILTALKFFMNPLNASDNNRGIKLEDVINEKEEIISHIGGYISTEIDYSNFEGKETVVNSIKYPMLFDQNFDFLIEEINKPLGSFFHARDIMILETLFWPVTNLYQYTKVSEKEFLKNLELIRPWLDEPFKFELDIMKNMPEDTPQIKDIEEINNSRRELIKFWEFLNNNHNLNLVKPL